MAEVYFSDYESLIKDMIESNWGTHQGVPTRPFLFFSESENISHDYTQGSSIWINQGAQSTDIQSMGYTTLSKSTFVYVTLTSMDRPTFYEQVNELIHTIMRFRRAVDGWDVVLPKTIHVRSEYINFYSCTVDIQLRRISQPIEQEGTA